MLTVFMLCAVALGPGCRVASVVLGDDGFSGVGTFSIAQLLNTAINVSDSAPVAIRIWLVGNTLFCDCRGLVFTFQTQ